LRSPALGRASRARLRIAPSRFTPLRRTSGEPRIFASETPFQGASASIARAITNC
jgi:hypothetical protein